MAFPSYADHRYALSAYNPRALGVSLGILGHRTDLVQEISERDWDRAHTARTHLRRIENGKGGVADRAVRVECLKYSTEIERVLSGYQVLLLLQM